MSEQPRATHWALTPLLLVSAWSLMLVMHGAVPFLLSPTLGQAVWSTGFSQSFVNQSLWTVYATNFGAPEPAAMAFGLPGAWLTALYIQLGLQPPDAYSAMVASWMTLAMGSAYAMARHFSVKPVLAILAALGWMSMPVIWAHAGYSMLSIGIALLPLYFLSSLKLLEQCAPADYEPVSHQNLWKLSYPLVCILAVFMDGYSFMFFAVGASLLGGWWCWKANSAGRKRLALIALPLHMLGLLAAYLLYGAFVGKSGYSAAPLDSFRGWGADLIFFARPTLGMHWLPDILGWSVLRSNQQHFGDASVWVTTFSIPVIIGGTWAAWRMARIQRAALGLLLMTGFGFYMAMGPSIKLNSVKSEGIAQSPFMPAEAALAPTGSGILSERLPGFNNMRASYRWTALGVFGAWGLLLLAQSTRNQRGTQLFAAALMVGVILLNLPDLPKKWTQDAKNRSMFFQLETDLVDDMRQVLHAKERVAFLPYRNDFLVNYLAARLNIVSFNIGGDKNLETAMAHWPSRMRGFQPGQIDAQFANRIVMLLASRQADSVILPYSDMLWAAHTWPYPQEYKNQMQSVARSLQRLDMFTIIEREHYITVRLNPEYRGTPDSTIASKLLKHICLPPLCLKQEEFNQATQTLSGIVTGNRLLTRGEQGFLLYGPSVEMNPGEYILTVYGSSQEHTGTWVDVASNLGKTQHARYALAPHGEHVLLEARVTLPTAVNDLEVRVFAGPQDQLQLDGYKLQPVITPTSPIGPP